ncbi:MAG TPA: DPP IV N-terminal domain-containing protein, partial [Phycisphaerales bacterium]|nr:DPP IV N-terminal domain-containing protein [Phycisphaerales bacterium]
AKYANGGYNTQNTMDRPTMDGRYNNASNNPNAYGSENMPQNGQMPNGDMAMNGMNPNNPNCNPNSGQGGMGSGDTNTPGMNTPGYMSAKNHRPGQKLEPFWISMIAEADRAVWDDQFKADRGMDALATRTAGSMPTMRPTGDDGAEGLSHVTYAMEGADFDPCVSRDGRYIAYSSTQHRPTSDIYIKTVGGHTVTQLTADPANDVMPAFSPDGQRIAFCSNRNGNWDIFVMSVTGGQALQLTSDVTHELHPSWSPDGKKIAFCRLGETSGRWEMWVMEVGGSGASEFLGYGMFPQWCPLAKTGTDGRDRILFQRSRERGDHAFSIWCIDYRQGDTSSPTEIAAAQGQALINASWSPDGTRVVYATLPNPNDLATASDKMPQSSLWMTNVDGTQRVLLTSGPFMNLMPTWSADGRIYFVSDRTGSPNVWSIGTDRAITAATGRPSEKFSNTETAHAAPRGNEATTPANAPASANTPAAVSTVPEEHGSSEGGEH